MQEHTGPQYFSLDKASYLVLLLLFVVTFISNIFLLPTINPLYLHLSNFAITGCLFLAIHTTKLTKTGYTKNSLLIVMAPYAVLNIIVELFVNISDIRIGDQVYNNINTADPIDAIFGIIALVFLFLYITSKRYARSS